MGSADQYAKRVLELESPQVTSNAVIFAPAPEIATPSLTPDGVLTVTRPGSLSALPAPWSRLSGAAVTEVKMPGDHLDPYAFFRCVLRWHARWCQQLEAVREPSTTSAPEPGTQALWVVASHVPTWLPRARSEGWLTVKEVAPGCTEVGPYPFPLVWIAANDLPLEPSLIPFLIARSGRRFVEFVRWAVNVRPPSWLADLLTFHPEGEAMASLFKDLQPDPEHLKRLDAALRDVLLVRPHLAEDFRDEGREQGLRPLRHLIERKLGRPLTEGEQQALTVRLGTLGADRLGDVVLDLDREALSTWLSDPDAR